MIFSHHKVFIKKVSARCKTIISWIFLIFFSINANAQISYRHFLTAGQAELSRENYVGAISCFNTAIQSKKDGFEAWFLRGIAKNSLGDYRGAVNDFSKTVRLHPLYTRAYFYRGICYDKLSEYRNALNDFNKALELAPFDGDVFTVRGETKMHIGDYKGAVKDFSSALRIKPDDPQIFLNRGVARYLAGEVKAALADLKKSIELNPYNPDVFIKRGMIYYETDSLAKSLNDYNKAVSLDNRYPFTYFQRALTFLKMKDTAAVLRDYTKVLSLDSTNALTFYNRSLIEAGQKNYTAALKDLDNVILLNPENIYAWFNRGVIHMETKNFAEAEKDFTKTVMLFPDFTGGYINRSIVREQLGDKKGAFRDREQARQIIAMTNSGKNNARLLYKRYADSVYFRKIIRFESDFISGDMKRGKVQYNRTPIAPKPDFQVVLYREHGPDEETTAPRIYFDERIVRFNADNDVGIKLGFAVSFDQQIISDSALLRRKAEQILATGDTAGYFFVSGILQSMQGNLPEAFADYDSTLRHNPNFAYALLNRGAVRFQLENREWSERRDKATISISKTGFRSGKEQPLSPPSHRQAASDYSRLVMLDPALPYVYYNRANLKTAIRKFQRAIDDYSLAIRLNPKIAEAYYNRALVLLYLKENKLACKDLSKAGELGMDEAYYVIKKYCEKK